MFIGRQKNILINQTGEELLAFFFNIKKNWIVFCRCENLNDKARVKPLALRHLSGID